MTGPRCRQRHSMGTWPNRRDASRPTTPTQAGFTLMEIIAAITILAMVAGGFAVSMSLGLRTVALARQRQTAADLATARLEHLRSVPYSQIATNPAPVHNSDPTNPDYFVSGDGSQYDIDGEGTLEPLVVDEIAGGVLHLEDPVQVGATVMEIYQYVTWVDDPSIAGTQDYKRVTVVVRYKAPSVHGVNRIVRASSFFGVSTVTIGGATTTTAATTTSAATTTTVPATTTTLAAPCPGDTSAPTGSFTLNGTAAAEAGFTAGANVSLNLSFTDSCTPISVRVRNESSDWGGWFTYDPVNQPVSWALSAGDGTKEVVVEVQDAQGNSATTSEVEVVLDTTLPSVPGTLNRTVSCAGANRTVNLTWSTSTDANFRGYRVYKSTDGTTWSVLTTTTVLAASDTHKKSLDSVRFYVVGYDKAGNESVPTNTVSLSKNQCS